VRALPSANCPGQRGASNAAPNAIPRMRGVSSLMVSSLVDRASQSTRPGLSFCSLVALNTEKVTGCLKRAFAMRA